ncbi:phage tail tube protein [Minwuia thermotolerans]|uniref:Uncharacterized protein n=1 Tax=Minwuia thermotolerans TaxID=2056226 RepID=A0A2M9G2N6_9PROT|nr:phage tail tube protein [Minwuia thermotolerans]PJK29954.1 hypothetical protein CVT23_09305 [Minwuia thermotolerans]
MSEIRARGLGLKVLAAFESAFGTKVDGSGGGVYTQLPVGAYSLGKSKALNREPVLHGGRDMNDPYYEAQEVSGQVRVPIDQDAIGFWLKLMAGAPDTTDNVGDYTHVFTFGAEALPSMSIDAGHARLATAKHFLHTGVKANAMSFESGRGGQAWATLDLVAQDEAEASSAEDATPATDHILVPKAFLKRRGVMTLGGSAIGSLMGWSMSVANNLEAIEAIRADGLIEGLDEGEVAVTGDITVRFSTATDVQTPGKNETPVALQMKYDNAAADRSLIIDVPRAFLPQVKREVDGPDGVEVTYSWAAALDSADGYAAQATLLNTVASY